MSCRVLLSASRGESVLLSRTDPAAGPRRDRSHPVQRGAGQRWRTLRPSHRSAFRRQEREVEEVEFGEQSGVLRVVAQRASSCSFQACSRLLPTAATSSPPCSRPRGGRRWRPSCPCPTAASRSWTRPACHREAVRCSAAAAALPRSAWSCR